MTLGRCPTEIELLFGYDHPRIEEHVEGCERCAEFARVVRLLAADKDAVLQMSDEEVGKLTKIVLALLREDPT